MSYNPPPPPLHPRNTSQAHSKPPMAATQLPPLGPHTFSDPAHDPSRIIRALPLPSLDARPVLPPINLEARYQSQGLPFDFTIPRQAPISPSRGIPPHRRQATVSVESLLQPESYLPPRSRPRRDTQDSGDNQDFNQSSFQPAKPENHHVSPHGSPVYSTARSEDTDASRSLSQGESRYNVLLPSPPIDTLHRDSVSSYYSSRNSSIGYAGRPSTAPRSDEGFGPALNQQNT